MNKIVYVYVITIGCSGHIYIPDPEKQDSRSQIPECGTFTFCVENPTMKNQDAGQSVFDANADNSFDSNSDVSSDTLNDGTTTPETGVSSVVFDSGIQNEASYDDTSIDVGIDAYIDANINACHCSPNEDMYGNNLIDVSCGHSVCSVDGNSWLCNSGVWTSTGMTCQHPVNCSINQEPSCQSGTFNSNNNCTNNCPGTYYMPNACAGLIEGPGDGTNACYCLPTGTGAPNRGCPLDGQIHYYLNGSWK